MRPLTHTGRTNDTCLLRPLAALIKHNVVDLIVITDCRLHEGEASELRQWLTAQNPAVAAFTGPTSPASRKMEYFDTTETLSHIKSGGTLILMSASLSKFLISATSHYVAGHLVTVTLQFPTKSLHIIGFYGISSPTTCIKQHTVRAIANHLMHVLDIIGEDAAIALGDANCVCRKRDRHGNRLFSYDRNEENIVNFLTKHGFLDCHVLRHENAKHYTFCRQDTPISRIDSIWINKTLAAETDLDNLRSAIAQHTGPLLTDHRCAIASIDIGFAPDQPSPMVIGISGTSGSIRPRRWAHSHGEQAELFRNRLDSNGVYQQLATELSNANLPQWTDIARALTCLQVPSLHFTIDQLQHCQAKLLGPHDGRHLPPDIQDEIRKSYQLLASLFDTQTSIDLSARQQECYDAVERWLRGVHSAFLNAHGAQCAHQQPITSLDDQHKVCQCILNQRSSHHFLK